MLVPVHDVSHQIHNILNTFEWQHNFGAQGHTLVFRNATYNKVFVDILHVIISKERTSCTCAPYMMYCQCEHVFFAGSISVPYREAIADFSRLPAAKKKEDDHVEVRKSQGDVKYMAHWRVCVRVTFVDLRFLRQTIIKNLFSRHTFEIVTDSDVYLCWHVTFFVERY